MSDHPTNQVLFTNLVVKRLVEEAKTKPDLAHAIEGTRLRHSDAGSCARKIGLKVAGYEASDPMDGPGLWVTHLGHIIHEAVQEDMVAKYGEENVKIEATVGWDDLSASGHLDGLITLHNGIRICLELKTMGGFGFDKSIGLNRKAYALTGKPEGPRSSAKLKARSTRWRLTPTSCASATSPSKRCPSNSRPRSTSPTSSASWPSGPTRARCSSRGRKPRGGA